MLQYIILFLAGILLTAANILGKAVMMLPWIKEWSSHKIEEFTKMEEEEFEGCFFNFQMLSETLRQLKIDLFKTAKQGKNAPDVKLLTFSRWNHKQEKRTGGDGIIVHLADLLSGNLPLVVTFGSCSCPPFYRKLNAFSKLAQEFSDVAKFIVIYIEEAHPTDGWAFKDKKIRIQKHKKIEDRIQAAGILDPCLPSNVDIYVDMLTNEANYAYGGFPERLYIMLNGKVAFQGGMGPFFYDTKVVRQWLCIFKENRPHCKTEVC